MVILNWNGAHHLKEFLPSVVKNTSPDIDIVVADNGSTDSSLTLLKEEFSSVRVVALDQNYGFAEGYNRAIKELDYEFIILLNSDVEVTPAWTTPLLDELKSSPSIGAVAPKILALKNRTHFEHAGAAGGFIDYLGYPFCRGRILGSTEEDSGQYDDADIFWASGAAFACRSEVFNSFGGFCSTFFAHMEEIDLCWRMQLRGYTIRYQPHSAVYHLGGGTLQTNSPRKIYLNHRNNIAMLIRCAPTAQLFVAMALRPALDMIAAVSYIRSCGFEGFTAVIKAHVDIFKSLSRLRHERHAIRSQVKAESETILKGSILVSYLLGRRTFATLRQSSK